MAIHLTKESKVLVQGMTGGQGMRHTRRMLAAGTNVVGGVNPRKAGRTFDFDGQAVPVFGSVADGMRSTGADVTVVFVPPAFAKAAVIEAADARIPLAVVITEGIPVHDTVDFTAHARHTGTRIIGPNCPGLITPGQSNAGIVPADITKPGPVVLQDRARRSPVPRGPRRAVRRVRRLLAGRVRRRRPPGPRSDPGPGGGAAARELPRVPTHDSHGVYTGSHLPYTATDHAARHAPGRPRGRIRR